MRALVGRPLSEAGVAGQLLVGCYGWLARRNAAVKYTP